MELASKDLRNEQEAFLFSLKIIDEISKRSGGGECPYRTGNARLSEAKQK